MGCFVDTTSIAVWRAGEYIAIDSYPVKLSVPPMDDIGLNETLQELCDAVEITKKLRITLDTSKVSCNHLDNDLHLSVYRIAQEQLTNILKHAEAEEVLLKLEIEKSALKLTIRDDGKGFDPDKTNKGIGLANIKNRIRLLNGEIKINSKTNSGTQIKIKIPYKI